MNQNDISPGANHQTSSSRQSAGASSFFGSLYRRWWCKRDRRHPDEEAGASSNVMTPINRLSTEESNLQSDPESGTGEHIGQPYSEHYTVQSTTGNGLMPSVVSNRHPDCQSEGCSRAIDVADHQCSTEITQSGSSSQVSADRPQPGERSDQPFAGGDSGKSLTNRLQSGEGSGQTLADIPQPDATTTQTANSIDFGYTAGDVDCGSSEDQVDQVLHSGKLLIVFHEFPKLISFLCICYIFV